MKLHRHNDAQQHQVDAYDAKGFRVRGQNYVGGILIGPDWIIHPWGPERADAIQASDFAALHDDGPEILLLGTGRRQHLLIPLMRALMHDGLAVECMDTSAACRTFNILLAEDRPVVAALLPAGL